MQFPRDGITTYFIGNYYEVTGSTVTKYYVAGASRVAMNQGGTVFYLLSDQLGSVPIGDCRLADCIWLKADS